MLFAVHLSDGVLQPLFLGVGFAVAALLVLPALWRVDEDEIPRMGLLTAAFFVASLTHVKLGVTSVHLLLNGLVGVILGRRAPLAILVALALQAFLLGHGGFTTLGVNAAIMAIPAIIARGTFVLLAGRGALAPPRAFFASAVAGGLAVLLTAVAYAAVLMLAGEEDFRLIATVGFAAHLPLAGIEAVIVGFACGYLAKAKPQMLRQRL